MQEYKLARNEKELARGHSLIVIECTNMGPDDGNPYFVRHTWGNYGASLACATDTGELTHDRTGETFKLTQVQLIFLNRVEDKL